MKLSSLLLPSLLCAASASAQYFSAGWTPGQPVPPPDSQGGTPNLAQPYERAPSAVPTPESAPVPPASGQAASGLKALTSLFDVNRLLTSGPVASLFGKMGVNISEAVAQSGRPLWDPRIPLITDENWEEIVVNEPLTEAEEKDRVWFIIITVTAGSQSNALSKMVDQSFDDAFNQTVIAKDLPNVRWGRIDYLNVTYLTTKWAVWTGPYLLVATDRGQTLRFYKADRVRVSSDLIRELLVEELWRNTAPWKTNFAPGGKREWVLHYYALAMKRTFDFVNRFPRWVLMIASGGIASVVMRLLHRNPGAEAAPAPAPAPAEKEATVKSTKSETVVSQGSSTAVASAPATSPSKSKRKGGKKQT
ncbi:hypothetical protein FKP32DRAFT_1591048 [Trametes sanguinea]|nr:hypothetical protein FKP32DRAFT_1591048 [Trametes sanguinea]